MSVEGHPDVENGEGEKHKNESHAPDVEEEVTSINDEFTAKDSEVKEEMNSHHSEEDSKTSCEDLEKSVCINDTEDETADGLKSIQRSNETDHLEITLQYNDQDCETRTKNAIIKGFTQHSEDVDLGHTDAILNKSLDTTVDIGQISLEQSTSNLSNDNTTTDNESTNYSVSIDLPETQQQTPMPDLDSESDEACRICHSGNETEVLISPCLCMGTVKYIHHSCLMDWLKRCVKNKCELCLHPISIHRKTKPLTKWRLPSQKPTPLIWLLTFVVALTLNIASIAKDGSQKCISNPCIIFYVVGALGAMLGFAFFYHWLLVSITWFKQWMALNEEWTFVGTEIARPLGNANLAVSNKSLETNEQRQRAEVAV